MSFEMTGAHGFCQFNGFQLRHLQQISQHDQILTSCKAGKFTQMF